MLKSPRGRFHRGITLLEILVVLSIIGAMCGMAAGMFPSAMQYFRARRSMEQLLWDLRRVQQVARSRGHAVVTAPWTPVDPSVAGLVLYAGTVRWDGAALVKEDTGYSYLAFSRQMNPPPTDITGLNPALRAQVVNLDGSLIPVEDGSAGGGPPRILPRTLTFTPDVANGLGDIVPAAGSVAGCAGCPSNIDFRLQNDDGYFRIQIEHQRFIGLRYVSL